MLRFLRTVSIGALLSLVAFPAAAQMMCAERSEIARELKSRYTEQAVAFGITADGQVMELFSSPRGSWTMLVTFPDGRSCLVSHGEDWQKLPPAIIGQVS
jgi:hypothetical protein